MSNEKKTISLVKATLSTGKVVLLRELKISHSEKAAMMVADKAGENSKVMQILMQKELIKMVLFKVNDKELSLAEKDDFDNLFTIQEYSQIAQVVGKMNGGDDGSKEAKIELVASNL